MNDVISRKETWNQKIEKTSFSDIQEQLHNLKEQFSTKNFSEDFDDKLKALEKNVATLKANESYKEAIKTLETIEGEIKLLREKYWEVVAEYKQVTQHLQASIGKTLPQGHTDYQDFLTTENGMSDLAKQARVDSAQRAESDLQQMKEEFPFWKSIINRITSDRA